MTDIHDLDQYVGQYATFTEGEEGASGFLVDVAARRTSRSCRPEGRLLRCKRAATLAKEML